MDEEAGFFYTIIYVTGIMENDWWRREGCAKA